MGNLLNEGRVSLFQKILKSKKKILLILSSTYCAVIVFSTETGNTQKMETLTATLCEQLALFSMFDGNPRDSITVKY